MDKNAYGILPRAGARMDASREPSVHPTPTSEDVTGQLSRKIVGQPAALQHIIPYIQTYQAGLNSPGRPAGIFLLLGPTGTGKTRTVEALAEILHGNPRRLLKIDCAEYQSDHEVAKLIGAPPGYVGHRETKALLSQDRLLDSVSEGCDLALVLFDEIEKAAPALTTLLLGVLDKATLRLGDNTSVNFEKALIFLTSNLGARDMFKEVQPDIGFQAADGRSPSEIASRLESIALAAVRKRFTPEFVNRLDVVITYRPLDAESLSLILDTHIAELQRHVHTRLGERSFEIEVLPPARQLLLEKGSSPEYGARELKRTIHRLLTQPLASAVAGAQVEPRGRVIVDLAGDGNALKFQFEPGAPLPEAAAKAPVVLILDDNTELLDLLRRGFDRTGITPLTATTAEEARQIATREAIDLALIDIMLPDGDGLSVAFEFVRRWPRVRVVVMTGSDLTTDEIALCERQDFPILRKPFLLNDVTSLVQASVLRRAERGG